MTMMIKVFLYVSDARPDAAIAITRREIYPATQTY